MADPVSGAGFPPALQGERGNELPFLKVGELGRTNSQGYFAEPPDTIDRDTASLLRADLIAPGTPVLAKIGAAVSLRRVGVTGITSCIDNNMVAMVPRPGTHPRYLYFALHLLDPDLLLNGGAVPNLNMGWVRQTALPWFDPWMQQQIADYLDHETAEIDAFIADLEKLKSTLDEHRMAELASVLPYPTDLFRADSSTVVPLRHLGSITLGKMLDPSPTTAESEYRYLRAANIQPLGRLDLSDLKTMHFTRSERALMDVRRNDVLIVEGGQGGFGRAAYAHKDLPELGFQNSIVRVRPHSGVDGRYVAYALHLLRHAGYIKTIASVTSMPHFTAEKVAVTPVPIASPERQREVADALDARWAEVANVSADIDAAIALAKERRAALITAAVTGQIDVTTRQKPMVDSIGFDTRAARATQPPTTVGAR
ncbi:hypothetical protein ABZ477_04745 [Microbacterium sp. NPDC019599]|uniref:hypothetical protein n=1 Tax=Microbacterium sp. NPDC019599 TaxID=3154690 RepID=UPI0033DB82F1